MALTLGLQQLGAARESLDAAGEVRVLAVVLDLLAEIVVAAEAGEERGSTPLDLGIFRTQSGVEDGNRHVHVGAESRDVALLLRDACERYASFASGLEVVGAGHRGKSLQKSAVGRDGALAVLLGLLRNSRGRLELGVEHNLGKGVQDGTEKRPV